MIHGVMEDLQHLHYHHPYYVAAAAAAVDGGYNEDDDVGIAAATHDLDCDPHEVVGGSIDGGDAARCSYEPGSL